METKNEQREAPEGGLGEQPAVRVCGQKCEVYSRVVVYLSPVNRWNKGKKAEYQQRTAFSVPSEQRDDTGTG